MKHFLYIWILFFTVLTTIHADTTTGLVAHYEFEGNAIDRAGYDNNATENNVTYVTGQLGQAASFDGVSSKVSLTNLTGFPDTPNGGSYAISAWIKPNLDAINTLITWGDLVTNQANAINMDMNGTSNYWYANDLYAATPNIYDGNWHHLVAQWDGTTKTIIFDGVEVNSISTSGLIAPLINGYIGVNATGTADYYNGLIDDVRIYNRALTPTDIGELYNPTPKLSLAAHGGAVQFDNVGSYINISSGLGVVSDENNSLTIEGWVKTTSTELDDIFSNNDGTTANQLQFRLTADGLLDFGMNSDAEIWTNITSTTIINDGNWHHVSVVKNGTTATIYVDGNEENSSSAFTHIYTPIESIIGGYTSTGGYIWNGEIDEIRIWNTARSQLDIQANINHQLDGNETGLVAYYNFDERVGTVVKDITANGYDGTIDGNVTRLNFLGDGLSFDGIDGNNNITVLDNTALDLNNTFTINSWFKTDENSSTGIQQIVNKYNAVGDLRSYALGLVDVSGVQKIQLAISPDGNSTSGLVVNSISNIEIGKWYHVSATSDGSNIRIYINGILDNTVAYTQGLFKNNVNLKIGASISNIEAFNGEISELSIWNQALSELEIQKNMYSSLKGDETGLIGYWPLNESTGNISYDRSINSNDGNITGATWVNSAPEIYGDKIYIDYDINSWQKVVAQNVTSPAFTQTGTNVSNFDASTGLFLYSALSGTETFTINETSTPLSLNVNVISNNQNTAPVINAPYAYYIDENLQAGAPIGNITATDADADTLTFTISGTDASIFTINSSTGALSSNITFDFEMQSMYIFDVNVSDGLADTIMSMTVYVNDIAEGSPAISVSPVSFDFGYVPLNGYAETSINITNIGDADLSLTGFSLMYNTEFSFDSSGCPAQLAPSASCNVNVSTSPTVAGMVYDDLNIYSNDPMYSSKMVTLNADATPVPSTNITVSTLDETLLVQAIADVADGGTVTITTAGTILLNNTLSFYKDVIIQGPGADLFKLDASATYSDHLYIAPGVNVTISGITMQNGAYGEIAAGIYNGGNLTLEKCVVQNNAGAIRNAGSLIVRDSSIINNISEGGIYSYGSSLSVINSTISGNTGGGINVDSGDANISHSTIAFNTGADYTAGGVHNAGGTVNIKNSIVSNNIEGLGNPYDVDGTITSLDYNIITATYYSDIVTTITEQSSDVFDSIDPLLVPLAPYGSTFAHYLELSSIAIDNGICTDIYGINVDFDQNGIARPQGTGCEVGAVEIVPLTTFISPQTIDFPVTTLGTTIIYDINITNTDSVNLEITDKTIIGDNAAEFTVTNNCTSIAPSSTCIEQVSFTPISTDIKLAQLNIFTSDPQANTFSISLSSALNGAILVSTADEAELKKAVLDAPDGSTIYIGTTGTIFLTSEISIDKTITIQGPGADLLVLDGANITVQQYEPAISVLSGNVNISGITVQNGTSGGIWNSGTLTLDKSVMRNNNSPSDLGGAIWSDGLLFISNSSILDNNASGYGGQGGAIWSAGSLNIINSTISGNEAGETGGGIHVDVGDANISHSTIAFNKSGFDMAIASGGGIYNNTANINIKNTIIANNYDYNNHGPDLFGNIVSLGNNLITTTQDATIALQTSDINGTDPLLETLTLNGSTFSHALGLSSIAIDSGTCADIYGLIVDFDQHGIARPQGSGCDIGSFESIFTVNLSLSNVNILEHAIISVSMIGQDGNTESFVVDPSYIFVNGENNISAPVYNSDQNFSTVISLNDGSQWWVNFTDGKLYDFNDGSNDFKTNVNSLNNTFVLDFTATNIIYNSAPSISFIYNHYRKPNFTTFSIPFDVNDTQADPLTIVVNASSSNIISVSAPTTAAANSSQTIDISPIGDAIGSTYISISAIDSAGAVTSIGFQVDVSNDFNVITSKETGNTLPLRTPFTGNLYVLYSHIGYENLQEIGYEKIKIENSTFNTLEQVTDINSTVTLSLQPNTMPDTFEFEDAYISNTTLTTLYNDNGMPFTFSDINSKGKRVYITYPDVLMESHDIAYGPNGGYTSLSSYMADQVAGKTTYGVMRNITRDKLLLFNQVDIDSGASSGDLIEVDENGVPTNALASWAIETINSNQTLILDTSALTGYAQDMAVFLDYTDGMVKNAEYKAANDVYSYVLLNREAKDEIYNLLSPNPKLSVNINAGYTYVSIPNSISLCDSEVQSSLATICDQNNTLESIFGSNTQIETLYKYSDEWLYWDSLTTVNASYMINKFSSSSPLDGLLVKASSATTVNIPFDFEDESVNDYSNMPVERWLLLSNNKSQTALEIKTAIETQGKTLMYIQLLRDNVWYVYAPTNNELVDISIPRLSTVNRYESYWIYIK